MKKLQVTVNGVRYEVEVEVIEDDEEESAPSMFPYQSQYHPMEQHSMPVHEIKKPTKTVLNKDDKTLTSPINGIILEIPVKPGQTVKENEVLLILESMKMKTNISSPVDGKIKAILVNVNDNVETGQKLITFE